jgi:hypothetical protein
MQYPNLNQLVKEFRIRVKTEQLPVCSVTEHTIPIVPTLTEISNLRGKAKKLNEAEFFLRNS